GGYLIADTSNHRVRRVAPDGTITTVAGTGVQGFLGDGGQATSARLSIPFGVATTADGGFLIVDVGNQRVRKVSASGVISTVGGGDGGPATAAQLAYPKGVAVDASGNVYIADEVNNKVRFVGTPVAPANVSAPTISGTSTVGSVLTGAAGGWSGTGPSISYQW